MPNTVLRSRLRSLVGTEMKQPTIVNNIKCKLLGKLCKLSNIIEVVLTRACLIEFIIKYCSVLSYMSTVVMCIT